MALDGRKERLRFLLWQTLQQQVPPGSGKAETGARQTRLPGPWGSFFNENTAWDCSTQLSRELYLDLSQQFDSNLVREVLLAAADIKISRTTLSDTKIEVLGEMAKRHGFEIVTSEQRWILHADRGKGGWANGLGRLAGPSDTGAVRNVYIGSDVTLAETGRMLDEAGEDDLFGALLGIPACCREAFERFRPAAAEKQNDLVPYTLDNTPGPMPFDWRLNCVAQYFGASLLSFFPCSFRCPAAAEVADATFKMMTACDEAWARRFLDLHKSNVLYSEKDGLHLFRVPLNNSLMEYRAGDLLSSEATELARLLQLGNRLEVFGKHGVKIYRGMTELRELAGDDVCFCSFF